MTNIDIKNAYVGTTEVKAMYLGSTKVWPVETLSRPKIGDSVSIQTCTQYGDYNNAVLYWPDGASTQPGKDDGYTVLPFTLLPFKEK